MGRENLPGYGLEVSMPIIKKIHIRQTVEFVERDFPEYLKVFPELSNREIKSHEIKSLPCVSLTAWGSQKPSTCLID